MCKVAIVSEFAADYHQHLAPHFPTLQWQLAQSPEQLSLVGLNAEILLAAPQDAAQLVAKMPKLRWCHSTFAGVDALLAPLLPRHYQLTNSRGSFGPLMSEYVFSHLLAHFQQHHHYAAAQRQAKWQPIGGRSLQGLTLFTLGSGSIAQHLAGTARHFGMHSFALSASGSARPHFEQVFRFDDQLEQLAKADIVVAVLPHTQQTDKLIDQHVFDALSQHAWFFNVGRGATVDQQAMLRFAQANPQARLTLDVFEQEPLAEDSPLWAQANITITPHIAAPSRVADIAGLFQRNLQHYLTNEALEHVVEFDRGY
ncbi:D-2-hydroxyacid dehydrogenase [Aliagarivorans marinus]|uniref:D-2-hydroxyacid dehydrogenase n=1 Tax=Aliagarivorans marinus TaxID=561965 RepID=UPI0003FEA448|nr:D-2-hydroxyacid dehydrogenase [Aliagarivorans marinus]